VVWGPSLPASNGWFSTFLPPLPSPSGVGFRAPVAKPRVFVSYHHGEPSRPGDQQWADEFRNLFSGLYEIFYDKSLNNPIDSRNLTYIDRTIREDYISGSSVTVLLCGAQTWKRKCVDWELKATLDKRHALLGIALPTASRLADGRVRVPDRFMNNYSIGYAGWLHWTPSPVALREAINDGLERARRAQPDNSMAKMQRNLA
jgi:hypothetical protein